MRLGHALKIYALAVGACFSVFLVARLSGASWLVAMTVGWLVPAVLGAAYLTRGVFDALIDRVVALPRGVLSVFVAISWTVAPARILRLFGLRWFYAFACGAVVGTSLAEFLRYVRRRDQDEWQAMRAALDEAIRRSRRDDDG